MIASVIVLALLVATSLAAELQHGIFVTKLDHFRPQDERTVNFTYAANFEHYQPGGPFFVFLKEPHDLSTRWIESGLMVDIARNTSGALFTYDTRYSGDNIPTLRADLDSLQFLTPEQMLHDLATFIEVVHRRYADSPRTIVWGSGHGGTLASWARKKFPHLVAAAWSSSGLYDVHVETLGYYDSLAYNIHKAASFECRNLVQAGFEELDALVRTRQVANLTEALGLCGPIDLDDEQHVGALFEGLLWTIQETVSREHTQGVRQFCEAMLLPADRPGWALGRWAQYVLGEERCARFGYELQVAARSGVEWQRDEEGEKIAKRPMAYLQCTQTGLFPTTDDVSWLPNRVPLRFHERRCNAMFGEGYKFRALHAANAAIARNYGALYQSVTNVLYTNGLLDPWFSHAIVYSRSWSNIVINIEHFGRSADLTSLRVEEASSLTQAKQIIFNTIIQWTSSYGINDYE